MSPVLLTVLLVAAPSFEVELLDGPRVQGQITRLGDGRLTIANSSSGTVALELEKVLGITAQTKPTAPAGAHPVRVELRDGSLLVADDYAVHGSQAKIQLAGGDPIEIPVAEVAAVRLQTGPEALLAQWTRIRSQKTENDVLASTKGETLDYHKGTLHDVTDKIVRFELDGDTLNVKRPKVFGIVYYHAADGAAAEPACTVVDASGSRWAARSLKLTEKLEWLGAAGGTFRRSLAEIAQIDLAHGKVVYLSDLKADAVYAPFFGMEKELPARLEFFQPRRDVSLHGKPLNVAGQKFTKGLSLHSRTEMTFTLPAAFSRLEAVAGIDEEVRPRGHVRLTIRGDGKLLKEANVAGGDAPLPLSIDVTGVRQLAIFVDYGDDMDVGDHLDLGNARLMK